MDDALIELVRISNSVGKDRSLVVGGFGNTSVKTADGKYMYIKASGTALKDMTKQSGWRRLKVSSVLAILKDKSIPKTNIDEREAKVANGILMACDDVVRTGVKPSIESCFHAMLDRCVIHLHPIAVLAYACAKKGRVEVEKLFTKTDFTPVWVPYADPGYMLAKRIEKLVADHKRSFDRGPAIMFLQNHGLVVTANSSKTALRLVRKTVDICNSKLKQPKPAKIKSVSVATITETASAIHAAVFQVTGKYVTVRHFIDETVARFIARRDAAQLCSLPAITPDELIYVHGPAIWLDKWTQQTILRKLTRQVAKTKEPPAAFLVKPLGLFVAGEQKQLPLIKDVVTTSLAVRSFAAQFGQIRSLNKRQHEFILRLTGKSASGGKPGITAHA